MVVYCTDVNLILRAVQCNNSAGRTTEMNNLKAFLNLYPRVKGIIIKNLHLVLYMIEPMGIPHTDVNIINLIEFN